MDGVLHAGWAAYPALAVLALGLWLAIGGVRLCYTSFPRPRASMQPLGWMRGFRLALFGLALAGVGAAWLLDAAWLFWLSLAIGGEETLETSIAIYALRRA